MPKSVDYDLSQINAHQSLLTASSADEGGSGDLRMRRSADYGRPGPG